MRIKVNGEEFDTAAVTIMQLLQEKEILPERVAVEVNLRVIRRADFAQHRAARRRYCGNSIFCRRRTIE